MLLRSYFFPKQERLQAKLQNNCQNVKRKKVKKMIFMKKIRGSKLIYCMSIADRLTGNACRKASLQCQENV